MSAPKKRSPKNYENLDSDRMSDVENVTPLDKIEDQRTTDTYTLDQVCLKPKTAIYVTCTSLKHTKFF